MRTLSKLIASAGYSIVLAIYSIALAVPIMLQSSMQVPEVVELQIANAAQASIVNPVQYRMDDNYGDPSRFVKYIIRRPPTLA